MLGEKTLANNGGYRIVGKGSPDLGFAYIKTLREDVDGVVTETYQAWFYYKMKYKLNSEESRTKERNLEWRVPTLNGRGGAINLGAGYETTFTDYADFTTIDDALEWIMDKFGVEDDT